MLWGVHHPQDKSTQCNLGHQSNPLPVHRQLFDEVATIGQSRFGNFLAQIRQKCRSNHHRKYKAIQSDEVESKRKQQA